MPSANFDVSIFLMKRDLTEALFQDRIFLFFLPIDSTATYEGDD